MVESPLNFYESDHRVLILQKNSPIDGGPKHFHFQPHWFEEKAIMTSIQSWWNETEVKGNPGFVLHYKLKAIKEKIKAWVKSNIGKIEQKISSLEATILDLECEEEEHMLSEDELKTKHEAIRDLKSALKSEELF